MVGRYARPPPESFFAAGRGRGRAAALAGAALGLIFLAVRLTGLAGLAGFFLASFFLAGFFLIGLATLRGLTFRPLAADFLTTLRLALAVLDDFADLADLAGFLADFLGDFLTAVLARLVAADFFALAGRVFFAVLAALDGLTLLLALRFLAAAVLAGIIRRRRERRGFRLRRRRGRLRALPQRSRRQSPPAPNRCRERCRQSERLRAARFR